MAHYGKQGTGYAKMGCNTVNKKASGGGEPTQRIPAYSTAYSGAAYAHYIQVK